jgi:hypothetical protein
MSPSRNNLRTKRRRAGRQHDRELQRIAAHDRAARAAIIVPDSRGEPSINIDAVRRAVRAALASSGADHGYGVDLDSARVLSVDLPLSFASGYPPEAMRLRVALEFGKDRWDPRYAVVEIRNFRGWRLESIDVRDRLRDGLGGRLA